MAYSEGDGIFGLGATALDRQHQVLSDVVETLFKEVTSCQTIEDDRAITGKAVEQLQTFASLHFPQGKKELTQNRYTGLPQYEPGYMVFLNELQRLRNSHAAGEVALSYDVYSLARQWIDYQVNNAEQKYISLLNATGQSKATLQQKD